MNWKVVTVSAGIAFILSFISGLIGRVSALGLLIRAVLGAVLFGGIIAALMALMERYLPELADVMFHGGTPASTGEGDHGGVDILVPDDGIPEDLYQRSETDRPDEDIALEINEMTSEEVPEEPSVSARKDTGTGGSVDILDSLDSLPDLDVFAGAFVNTEQVKSETGTRSGSSQNADSSKFSPNAESLDPQALAKAVQTLLKKDREGK